MARDVMLDALSAWVEAKHGTKDAGVACIQDIQDGSGAPSRMNVVFTTNPALAGDVRLREAVAKQQEWDALRRSEIRRARQQGRCNDAKALQETLDRRRRDFVERNGLRFYRLSRSRDNPPILAHWDGIPVEVSRFDDAKALAEKATRNGARFSRLVNYTVAAPLLEFRSNTNDPVYVDPLNLRIVNNVATVQQATGRSEDATARATRIQAQWHTFLEQPSGTRRAR